MNRSILIFVVGALCFTSSFGCLSQDRDCKICGTWRWEKNDESHDFTVTIYLKDGFIMGTHCYILDSGKKMDCPTNQKDTSFKKANLKADTITLNIRSYYSGKSGDVKLELRKGKLHWKLTKAPRGEYYFPKEAVLVFDKN
jgi:hypothetical protein